jgi:hypothetical protein
MNTLMQQIEQFFGHPLYLFGHPIEWAFDYVMAYPWIGVIIGVLIYLAAVRVMCR